MLKLYEFSGVETEWVAAGSEAEARATLKRYYGANASGLTAAGVP